MPLIETNNFIIQTFIQCCPKGVLQNPLLAEPKGSAISCKGSVVVTAYDFDLESGRPGSNPEWGPIYYKVSITAFESKLALSHMRLRAYYRNNQIFWPIPIENPAHAPADH